MPVLTTDFVPGHEIDEYIGFVWGTTVQAKFLGHDIIAALRTLLGGEIWPYTRMINDARRYVIHRMVKNAKAIGADAIVGVRMGTAQVIPGTIDIFAYGTAVKLKK
ncbi:MAG: YbjQ family protein [Candidatus Diapherotrites archaeon]|nr:YbjQ family protein [Candidatus Diapherotrites archaeon]